jgi:drug/metabolite transporter (DMT)-like permease
VVSILAALGGALCVGGADFLAGRSSRSASPLLVATWINAVALVAVGVPCLISPPHLSSGAAVGAALGGVVAALAITLIYAALAAGMMSLTAPLIACGTSLVPSATATALGHPPDLIQSVGAAAALCGIMGVAWPAGSSTGHVGLSRRALSLTLAAAACAGIALATLQQAAAASVYAAIGVSGLARVTALLTCLAVVAVGDRTGMRRPARPSVVGAGLLDAYGLTLFLVGSRLGNDAVVAVVGSFYAIVTVLLAQTVLSERVTHRQKWGIVAAASGVALLAAG